MVNTVNSMFLVLGVSIGLVSLLLEWIYIYETCKDMTLAEYSEYKKQSLNMFWISVAVLFMIWLSIPEKQNSVVSVMVFFLILWIASFLAAVILSVILKDQAKKKSIRATTSHFVVSAIALSVVLWLIA